MLSLVRSLLQLRIQKPEASAFVASMAKLHKLIKNSIGGTPRGKRNEAVLSALNFGGLNAKKYDRWGSGRNHSVELWKRNSSTLDGRRRMPKPLAGHEERCWSKERRDQLI